MPSPTYTLEEIIARIKSIDREGMAIIEQLCQDEEYLYTALEYGKILSEINLRKAKLNFEDRKK